MMKENLTHNLFASRTRSLVKYFPRVVAAAIFICFGSAMAQASTQSDIPTPAGSGQFGTTVTVLPNGNYVVTDFRYSITTPTTVSEVGAVYLYNGATDALISKLTGSQPYDSVGSGRVTVLTNGNYVVSSTTWSNGATQYVGAVTWCSATTGCNGTVSPSNSFIGSTAYDQVSSVVALTNGNYAVTCALCSNGAAYKAGAVTFANGATGLVGVVSPSNSLVGSSINDQVGGVIALSNGNYVVVSSNWNNSRGAVTWGNGTTGTTGAVSSLNSLVGSLANDLVGNSGVYPLRNGNYVVSSPAWDNEFGVVNVGAVTWGNGTSGTVGAVSGSNSLVGSSANDLVGNSGVTVLANGNYVVSSVNWDDGAVTDVGAATWGNGATGIIDTVSAANSLVGSTANDFVGSNNQNYANGVIALTNGNYVVASGNWNNGAVEDAGAATWGNGATGIVGTISAANSLVGSKYHDLVARNSPNAFGTNNLAGVAALSNGNYVVSSGNWKNSASINVGAATWCNGETGTVGAVSSSNSLTGSIANDSVGNYGVTALTNGNYVVSSIYWHNAAMTSVGAATLGNGATGTVGVVSPSNSLVGSTANDFVSSYGVTSLSNGNYVVNSAGWNNGTMAKVGAVTFGNGITGIVGVVSSSNSLIGSAAENGVGYNSTYSSTNGYNGIYALANGNYVVNSTSWSNGTTFYAGAITFGAGNVGTSGILSTANSVLGATTDFNNFYGFSFAADTTNGKLYVGKYNENKVTIYRSTYTAASNGNLSALTYNLGTPSNIDDILIPSGRNVTFNANFTGNAITVENGATLALNGSRASAGNITINGTLNLTGNKLNMGSNTLTTGCGGTISNASASGYVIGSLQRCLNAASQTFPVGTSNGYSPVNLSNVVGTGNFTVKAVQGAYPNATGLPTNRLARWWMLTNGGITKADVTFNYLQSDITAGTESSYRAFRINGVTASNQGGTIDTVNNQLTVSNITQFSPWTLAEAAAPSFEADVSPRPSGDGFIDSDDIQQIRRFSVGLDSPYQSNEFQRADDSPRSTSGDGFVDSDDVQQARRYSVGLDVKQLAGGQPQPGSLMFDDWKLSKRTDDYKLMKTTVRVENTIASSGKQVTVPVRIDTRGYEAGFTFSLEYDAARLSNPVVTIGKVGGDVVTNITPDNPNANPIGFSITSFTGETIAAGANQLLVTVRFDVAAKAPAGATTIKFGDLPSRRRASGIDPDTSSEQPTFTDGTMIITAHRRQR